MHHFVTEMCTHVHISVTKLFHHGIWAGHWRIVRFMKLVYSYRFAFSAVYYGMTISAGNLGGSMYVNVALSGLSEIPGYLAAIFILQK